MSSKESIKADEEQRSELQATSFRRSDGELLQYYLDLPPKERDAQFADISRAALLIGVSPRTIQRWAKEGRIPAVLIGEKYRIEINSLHYYIKQRACARRVNNYRN